MLEMVAEYGASLNFHFFTRQDPGKCRSLCNCFVGPVQRVVYPSPLILNGVTFQLTAALEGSNFLCSSVFIGSFRLVNS